MRITNYGFCFLQLGRMTHIVLHVLVPAVIIVRELRHQILHRVVVVCTQKKRERLVQNFAGVVQLVIIVLMVQRLRLSVLQV